MKSRFIFILCFTFLAVLMSDAVFGQYKRDYKSATDAIEDGDYTEAIQKLKGVIAENPKSQDRLKIYGMLYLPYLPHYYLGQAYFGLDDCQSAITAWQEAINAGVIQEMGQEDDNFRQKYAQMQSDMKTCRTQGIDINSLAAQAVSEIDKLDSAINSYLRLRNQDVLAREWGARWEPLLNQATQTAENLRQRVVSATRDVDPDAMDAISAEAKELAGTLSSSERDALAQVETMRKADAERQLVELQTARSELDDIIRQANAAEKPADGSSEMNKLLSDLNRQVAVGQNLGSTAPVANIREQTQVINNVLRRYRASIQDWSAQQQSIARRKPPAELKRIAEAYFAGEYETAVGLVKDEDFSEDRARIQALLFRAAANHKLYVRGGEKSREVLRQIQIDIRAIKRMNRNFSPYLAAFSPSFLNLFRQTG